MQRTSTGERGGYAAQRSYSLAAAPGAAQVELTIERLDDGEVSPYFHDVARAGDTLEVRGPLGGHFVWRADDGGPLLLVGGGSGIVPLVSIARHRANVAPATRALLVYSARSHDEVIYRDELLAMDAGDEAFALLLATTRESQKRAQDIGRRVDRKELRAALARWGQVPRHAFVCGSNAFVESLASHMVDEGVAAARIRTERYGSSGS
ncbi:MAG: FAD-binding oxidoreductase [Casimicrobiaceae bacterium]